MAIIAGIDYSMNSPSICVWDTETEHKFENLRFFVYTRTKKWEGCFGKGNVHISLQEPFESNEERFRRVANWAKAVFRTLGVDAAAIEGYSMSTKDSSRLCQIAEHTGLLKQQMYSLDIPFEIYTPSNVKKCFTGNGAAKKPEMIEQFTKLMKYNLIQSMDVTAKDMKPVDDIADSYAIMRRHPLCVETLGEIEHDK